MRRTVLLYGLSGGAYNNPLYNTAITFLEPLPVGLIFSLVAAGVLSRRRKPSAAGPPPAQVQRGGGQLRGSQGRRAGA